ncbi:MAG: acyl-CoA dehydrogenase [Limisphaerales bacterium]|jgi:acyl-CoA dehydrogenase
MPLNHQLPRPVYGTEEHEMLKTSISRYFENHVNPHRENWEEQGYCDRDAWLKAGELGLLGITLDPKYGGMGLDFTFSALLLEEGGRHGAFAPAIGMHSDIVIPYIEQWGSDHLKDKYLPKCASGELIGSLAMTEPDTGSDVQAIKTYAEDKGDHYLLNGSKTFITIGYTCDFSIVACKTDKGQGAKGISLLIVDANLEGFSRGKPFKKLGLKTSDTCELFFEDVKVPKENLLGQEGMGFVIMMNELPRERMTIALSAIGAVRGALEHTLEYTQQRVAFKQPIAAYQNTQFKLVEVASELEILTAFVDRCTDLLKDHKLTPELASMAKYKASDMQCAMIDECLQLFGGYGYIWEYPIARFYGDARVQRIYGGTNEIMKILISRSLFSDYYQQMKIQRAKAKS